MWKTLSSKVIHQNKWYRVLHNKFETPNKKIGNYYIVKTNGSSIVIPIKSNKIILEKQYRYPLKKWAIELPCGSVKRGSNYLKTAKEELKEELGYKAKSIKKIGLFAPYDGVSSEICVVFLATDLKFIGENKEETEWIKTFEIEIKKIYKMVEQGKIIDGMTLAALALVQKKLLKFIK